MESLVEKIYLIQEFSQKILVWLKILAQLEDLKVLILQGGRIKILQVEIKVGVYLVA